MLILRRKKNESILIGENIRITIVDCASDGVRLAIDAPRQISILREELSIAEQENKNSIAPNFSAISLLQSKLMQHINEKKAPTEESAAAAAAEATAPGTPETASAEEAKPADSASDSAASEK